MIDIDSVEFKKFCNRHNISLDKQAKIYKEHGETLKSYYNYKRQAEQDALETGIATKPSESESWLVMSILDTYNKARETDHTENLPTYYSFRADDRFVFYKGTLKLFHIRLKNIADVFLKYFEDLDGSTFRYKSLQCKSCKSRKVVKAGFNASGHQRYKCSKCGKGVKRELNPNFHARRRPSCPFNDCGNLKTYKFGVYKDKQRYKCVACNRCFFLF